MQRASALRKHVFRYWHAVYYYSCIIRSSFRKPKESSYRPRADSLSTPQSCGVLCKNIRASSLCKSKFCKNQCFLKGKFTQGAWRASSVQKAPHQANAPEPSPPLTKWPFFTVVVRKSSNTYAGHAQPLVSCGNSGSLIRIKICWNMQNAVIEEKGDNR